MMLAVSNSLPPSLSTSLLEHLYRATELNNVSMGANGVHKSVISQDLFNTQSHTHAQTIYSISVTAHLPSFPCSLSLPTATREWCSGLNNVKWSHLSKECPNGSLMLWGDECVSVIEEVPL